MELLRTRLPAIGFGWNLLGYIASGNLALLQLTAVTGIYGLSLLVAVYNAVLAAAVLSFLTRTNLAHTNSRRAALRSAPAKLWLASTAVLLRTSPGSARARFPQPLPRTWRTWCRQICRNQRNIPLIGTPFTPQTCRSSTNLHFRCAA